MYVNDFNIIKENDSHFLIYEKEKVVCTDSDHFVEDKNRKIIEYIIEDFERCGNVKFNKNRSLKTNKIYTAYHVFSLQKCIVETKSEFKKFSKYFSIFPIHDFSLIQVGNGPPLEIEEMKRFAPVRNSIATYLGKNSFSTLTEYAWGCYYHHNYGGGVGTYISDDDFIKTKISKNLLKLFLDNSNAEKAAIISLFYANQQKSLLLPISFIKGWITKMEFVSGSMVLGGNIANLPTAEGTNKIHQEGYNFYNNMAELAKNYSQLFNDQSTILNKLQKSPILTKIEKGETKKIEFKETLSMDKKKKTKEKYIEESIMKTVAGFLNSEGGELFVGVNDNGEIIGIKDEIEKFYKSNDKLLLHFRNLVKKTMNESFFSFINYEVVEVDNTNILHITCEKSNKEVFINDELWVRTGPSTDKLLGQDMVNYIRQKFKNND